MMSPGLSLHPIQCQRRQEVLSNRLNSRWQWLLAPGKYLASRTEIRACNSKSLSKWLKTRVRTLNQPKITLYLPSPCSTEKSKLHIAIIIMTCNSLSLVNLRFAPSALKINFFRLIIWNCFLYLSTLWHHLMGWMFVNSQTDRLNYQWVFHSLITYSHPSSGTSRVEMRVLTQFYPSCQSLTSPIIVWFKAHQPVVPVAVIHSLIHYQAWCW